MTTQYGAKSDHSAENPTSASQEKEFLTQQVTSDSVAPPSLQGERRNRDIAERQRTIQSLFQEIYHWDDLERRAGITIAETMRRLGSEFEEIMLQKEQPDSVKDICSMICQQFKKDKRYWLNAYACRVLDPKYKKSYTEQSYRQSLDVSKDVPEECSTTENGVIVQLQQIKDKVDPRMISKQGHQKIADLCCEIVSNESQFATNHGFAVYSDLENKSKLDETNDEADKAYEGKVSEIPLPIPFDKAIQQVDAEAFAITLKLAETLKAWAIKQRDYSRSQTIEQAIAWRDSITAFNMIVEQYVDGKARRSTDQWGQILKTMAEHGGTAASSKSAMPVTDPDTGQPMIDPRTLKQIFRDITKEQRCLVITRTA